MLQPKKTKFRKQHKMVPKGKATRGHSLSFGGDLAGVGCQLEKNTKSNMNKLIVGESVTIKGICTGILIDVVLVDCVITE